MKLNRFHFKEVDFERAVAFVYYGRENMQFVAYGSKQFTRSDKTVVSLPTCVRKFSETTMWKEVCNTYYFLLTLTIILIKSILLCFK